MLRRTIICLANSKKGNGRCVAGVDAETLEWIRPIGSGWDGAVMLSEQRYQSGDLPAILDVISIPLLSPDPQPGQPENWTLAEGEWKKIDELETGEAAKLLAGLATQDLLFGTEGKALRPEEMAQLGASLEVFRPTELAWYKPQQHKVRAYVDHAGDWLDLSVSDPSWRQQLSALPVGTHPATPPHPFLVASVTVDTLNGSHWKLIAGVVAV